MTTRTMPTERDVALDDEVLQFVRLPKDSDFFEDFGDMVLGDAGGNDLLLWTSSYRIGGTNPGRWINRDFAMLQSTFVMVPRSERAVMHDSDFVCLGTNGHQYLKPDDLQIVKDNDRITWQIAGWQHVARPPYWDLKGHHAGIGYDLGLAALGSACWYHGPWEGLAETPTTAGYDQICAVKGTVLVKGQSYQLSGGFAVHEHVVTGTGFDMVPLRAKQPMHWAFGMNDDLQFFTYSGFGRAYGRVIVNGGTLAYDGPGEVSLQERDWWQDPRSSMTVPCKWHIQLSSSAGVLDVDVASSGRAYYFYGLSNGYVAMYWYVASANGAFTFPNGRSIRIEDIRMGIERGKTILAL